jgi:1,4-alpha-glucan branching enzyme
MPRTVRIHYDNSRNLADPHVWVWDPSSSLTVDQAPSGADAFGPFFDVEVVRRSFWLKFKSGSGTGGPWEPNGFDRLYEPPDLDPGVAEEIFCRGNVAFVYEVLPRAAELASGQHFLESLPFKAGAHVPRAGQLSGLGAHVLADGSVLFGLYHPNAARVYVMGDFNDWQRPNHLTPDPARFVELKRYRGYFGADNLWLGVTPMAAAGAEYKFCVMGGVPSDAKRRFIRYQTDPYARQLGPSFDLNNGVVVDPTLFEWHDAAWQTPDVSRLIIYELSVYGFTEGDPDIDPAHRGKFQGVIERIRMGYFAELGVTALALMPLAEFPSVQGPNTIGYDPSLYCVVERDFGSPDDLRELVDAAHAAGLAVILDQVFNHTSNDFNPLWQAILEHPGEEGSGDGGLYFNGSTPWGNRIATEKADVQNLLIDACSLLLKEYHVDGFRFDATHTNYMDHGLPLRLATELKRIKPDVLLIAENLPNQQDLNRSGFDGFAQWCDPFHDKIKAMLREGVFENTNFYDVNGLADIFYFSKSRFAAHTNNVVNYCESHDEHSVGGELKYQPFLNHPATKERKSRLGLFSTLVALGQPMIYMGQEFCLERERNLVTVPWPADLAAHGFFQWASRLIKLRRRYPGLRISGYDPDADGRFSWVVGPWLDASRGGGSRSLGYRLRGGSNPWDTLLVLLNFENRDVTIDVDFGIAGVWVKLADIDRVNDIAPAGTNSVADATALRTRDGNFAGFVLPSSSGFIYKWEGG